jgi:hypothetical protein
LIRNKVPYIIFLILGVTVAAINVGGNYIIHFIDIYWPINESSAINIVSGYFSAWSTESMGGYTAINIFNFPEYATIAFLYVIGIPPFLQEILLIGLMEFLSMAFSFRILKEFILKNRNGNHTIISFFSAIILTFNYSIIEIIWWDFIPNGFFLIGFGVAFLYYLLTFSRSYLMYGKFNSKSAILLFIFSSLSFSVNLEFNVNLIYLTLVFILYSVISFKVANVKLKMYVSYLIILTVFISLSNLWWIIPNIIFTVTSSIISSSSDLGNIGIYFSVTKGISFGTVLDGLYGYASPTFFSYSGYVNDSIYSFGKLFVDIIPASLIFGLFLLVYDAITSRTGFNARQNSSEKVNFFKDINNRFLFFLISVIPMSFVLIGGLGYYNLIYIIFKNGVIQAALRNPINALAFSYFYILIITISLSLCSIIDHVFQDTVTTERIKGHSRFKTNSRIVKMSITVVIVVALIFPFLTTSSDIYTGNALPVYPYQSRMVVPQFDQEVASYLKEHLGNHYVLFYPGGFLDQNVSNGYDAYDILPYLLPSSYVIDSSPGGLSGTSNDLISELYSLIGTGDISSFNVTQTLVQLNIKYIVIEGDLGGNFVVGVTPPDYPIVLNSLNLTQELAFAVKIGPDYIYRSLATGDLVSIVNSTFELNNTQQFIPALNYTHYLFNSSLAHVFPFVAERNYTSSYFNDTVASYNGVKNEVLPSWNNGIHYSLNASEKSYLNNTTDPLPLGPPDGYPSLFNVIPLHLNSSEYPLLMINFTTNRNTVLNFEGISQANLNTTNILNGLNLGFSSTMPYDEKVNPCYGGLKYNGTNTDIYFNIGQALSDTNNKTLNYLIIAVLPTYSNGSGLKLPINQWPGYQNFTINTIYAGHDYFFPPVINSILENATSLVPKGVGKLHYGNKDVLYSSPYVLPSLQEPLSYEYTMLSSTNYQVKITLQNSTLPFLVILKQNYFAGWTIEGKDVISSKHIKIDGSLNGFVVYPRTVGGNKITFNIIFQYQERFMDGLILGIIAFVLPLIAMGVPLVYSWKKDKTMGHTV